MPATVEVTTPSEFEIVVARTFDTTAQRLFDFYTKPKYVQRWLLGPPGWTMPVCEIDLRAGGAYHYRWRSDDGSKAFSVRGQFREIDAPNRLVQTENMDGFSGETLCTIAFEQSGPRTALITTIRFASREARDEALETGMTSGMGVSYDRLEGFMGEWPDAP